MESNFTAHELPNRRENSSISNPSNNANNSLNNNFSNRLNSTRRRPQVAINQNPENDNDYQGSKFVLGDKLYSEAGKHHSSTSNNNNIVVFGDSIPNLVENVNLVSIEISFLQEQDLSISLSRYQRISYVMSMRRYKTQRTMPLSSTLMILMIF